MAQMLSRERKVTSLIEKETPVTNKRYEGIHKVVLTVQNMHPSPPKNFIIIIKLQSGLPLRFQLV
jgi:hypothetical protein